MLYIANAFSLQMLGADCSVTVRAVTAADVKMAIYAVLGRGKLQYAIGHADTANVAAASLNEAQVANDWVEFDGQQLFNRCNVALKPGDVLYVLQVVGGRLPEGCTELPEGISLHWREVRIAD